MNVNVSNTDVINDEVILNVPEKRSIKENSTGYKILKRIFDIIGGICGTILLIPLTIGIYIANLISKDNGPVFYTQQRIAKDGKLFKMYKFRSMVVGADEILDKYLEENEDAREEYRINKKLKDDPRITKIGKFIRKTSIDEFPQFINVIKGDMSLVGPRPYLVREIEDIGDAYDTIIKCKPGVTGLWQINGRSNVTFEDRLKLDIEYLNKRSIIFDMKIIIKTFTVLFYKKGAR